MPPTRHARTAALLLIVAALVVVVTAACSPKSQLVGKWQKVNSTQLWQLYGDGTYDADSGGIFALKSSGTYSFPDNQHLRLTPTTGLLQQQVTVAFRFSNGQLIVTPLGGQDIVYQKVS